MRLIDCGFTLVSLVHYSVQAFSHISRIPADFGVMPKFDMFLDYLVERWGWTWFKQPEDAWRKKYPYVTKKIDELERKLQELEDRHNSDGKIVTNYCSVKSLTKDI